MKKSKMLIIGLLASSPGMTLADCCSWYDDVGNKKTRLEKYPSDGTLWLSSPNLVTIPRRDGSGTCTVNQIKVEAPVDQENEWFSLVLAATTAGKKLNVYGDCNEATDVLTASRVVFEYK